jgi:hypothetical protein
MAPEDQKIEECIYISHIRTCESYVFEPGHRLVIHLDTNEAYGIYYDYYSGY